MTIEELKIAISVDTTIFKQSIGQVKKDMNGLQEETNKVAGGVKGAFKKLVDGIASLKIGEKLGQAISDGVKDAINVEAATQQIKRIMGESSNQFLKWAGTQATAFNMSKSEALKYGSEFGNLVSRFTSNTSDTTKYTESLLKSSAVIASSTGRTMEDVMKSISSGIQGDTEAIEELGINVDSSMLQSTEAFSKFANGKSWDQLDSQTQQQIRLFAILEQSTRRYGDSVSQNTSSQLAQLVAQLKNAQLSLGEAFLPILNIVLPILTQFASGLAYVMNIVAQFSQALFGKEMGSSNRQVQGTQAQAKAMTNLGNATEKAGKKAKGALAGFDEINQLQKDSGDNNSGPALPSTNVPTGPMPLNFETNAPEIGTKIQEMADNFKRVLGVIFEPFQKSWDLYGPNVMKNVGTIFDDIKIICARVGETLYNIWTNPSVQESVILLSGIFSDLFTILTRIFDEIAKPIMLAFLDLIDPSKNPAAKAFQDSVREILSKVKELTNYLSGDGFKYVKDFLILFATWEAGTFVAEMAKATLAIIENTFATITDKAETLYLMALYAKDFIVSIGSATMAIIENSIAKGRDIIDTGILIGLYAKDVIVKGAATAAQWLHNAAVGAWNIICAAATAVTTAFGAAVAFLTSPIGLVIIAIAALIGIVVLLIKNWDTVKEVAAIAWNKIKEVWNVVAEWFNTNVIQPLVNFFSGLWNKIVNIFYGVKDWFGSVFSQACQAVKDAFSSIGSFFGGIWDIIKSKFTSIGSAIGDAIGGAFKYVVNSIIGFAENSINGFIRAINGAITLINDIPGVNISTIKYLDIPKLAKGGIVDSPTVAMIGEAGKEAVVPLENTSFVNTLASAVGTAVLNASQFNNSNKNNDQRGDIILQIDGSTFARIIRPYQKSENERIGNNLILQSI